LQSQHKKNKRDRKKRKRKPGASLSTLATTPPTSPFTGLFTGLVATSIFSNRHEQNHNTTHPKQQQETTTFPILIATTNILAKLTPILLSNVPFSPIQTWNLHVISAWATVGILGFMSLVLGGGMAFVRDPLASESSVDLGRRGKGRRMPFDPATLAGRIYYLCDSDEVLGDLVWFYSSGSPSGSDRRWRRGCWWWRRLIRSKVARGSGDLIIGEREKGDRNRRERRYGFGEMIGTSGRKRIGVFAVGGDEGGEITP
jgi:hypothetical protein